MQKAGGLCMVDIESKIKSLRLSWLPKIFDDYSRPWKSIFNFWLQKIVAPPVCFKINCSLKDMTRLCVKFHVVPFYKDLLCSWAQMRHVDLFRVKSVNQEILWFNSNIKFQNEMLYFKKWSENGINTVSGIFFNGTWIDQNQVNATIQSNSLLVSFEYQKLKYAFPHFFLDKLSNQDNEDEVNNQDGDVVEVSTGDIVNICSSKSKSFYNSLLKMKVSEPTILNKWQRELKLSHSFEWEPVFNFKLSHMKNNKIRQFNFKLIYNILPFKDNLFKWKISSNVECKFCHNNESLMHNLLHCPKVKNIWGKVKYLMDECSGTEVVIDERLLLIGCGIEQDKFLFINLIIIFLEYAIYKVYLIENYHKQNLTPSFIIREFKNEFQAYCFVVNYKT